MPDVRAFQSVVEAAEKAAAVGDFASAEALLREAADLQEEEFGPLHPDLASTFNNLAVVCEMAERPVEAERFYRRAYAIASATLGADHALVATSRDNLRDFCQARGLPLEEWSGAPAPAGAEPAPGGRLPVVPESEPPAPAPRAEPAPPPAPVPRAAAAVPTPEPVRATRPVPPARNSIRRASLWAALILVLLGAAAGLRLWTAPPPAASTASANAAPAAVTTAPAAPVAAPRSPVAVPESTAAPEAAPASGSARPAEPDPATPPRPATAPAVAPVVPQATSAAPGNGRPAVTAPPPERQTRDGTPPGVRVVVATVCRSLTTRGAWQCTPAGDASTPGAMAFYTRIASPRGLRVRHQWYQGDRLRQDVALRVGASPREGYRTFSRQTVGPGEWRVELRAENGALLDEARFVVR